MNTTWPESKSAEQALRPYRPDRSRPFDRRRAAHLLRRTGFGVPPAEMERTLADGLDTSVDRLLTRRPQSTAELDAIAGSVAQGDIEGLAAWFIARMVRSDDPLREKVALFWHGHFATSDTKIQDSGLMLDQLRLFLDLGIGRFGPLLTAVARDPAMLIWLDSERNRKHHPNENFARELFELFTLGIGNYTEKDVQEAARALTGWHRGGGRFRFVAARHDGDDKQVLGRRGPLGEQQILEICLEHPATSRLLTRKLLTFFVHPEPREDVIDLLAARFLERGLDLSWLLDALFRSEYFFAEENLEAHILSPTEFVVGALRTLGVRANAVEAARQTTRMGQNLFRPPSVKGWDGETAWIHAGSMVARMNCATRLARGSKGKLALDLDPVTALGFAPEAGDPARKSVQRAAERLLARPLLPAVAARLAEELDREDGDDSAEGRARRLIQAIFTLPEASIG